MKGLLNRFISGLFLMGVLFFLFLHLRAAKGEMINPFHFEPNIPIYTGNYFYVIRLTIAPILYGMVHFLKAKNIIYILACYYCFEIFNVVDMFLAYNQTPFRMFGAKALFVLTCVYVVFGDRIKNM